MLNRIQWNKRQTVAISMSYAIHYSGFVEVTRSLRTHADIKFQPKREVKVSTSSLYSISWNTLSCAAYISYLELTHFAETIYWLSCLWRRDTQLPNKSNTTYTVKPKINYPCVNVKDMEQKDGENLPKIISGVAPHNQEKWTAALSRGSFMFTVYIRMTIIFNLFEILRTLT
jgi:hypothetical protein